MADEDPKERIDRELGELLEEVRVALPGAEVLFAFLLAIAFTERFEQLTAMQQGVYFGALLLTSASTALLIAPTAYHRQNFRDGDADKEAMLFTSSHLAIASLLLLLGAVTCVVCLVADLMFGSMIASLVGAGTASWFLWFWFGLPLSRRARRSRTHTKS